MGNLFTLRRSKSLSLRPLLAYGDPRQNGCRLPRPESPKIWQAPLFLAHQRVVRLFKGSGRIHGIAKIPPRDRLHMVKTLGRTLLTPMASRRPRSVTSMIGSAAREGVLLVVAGDTRNSRPDSTIIRRLIMLLSILVAVR